MSTEKISVNILKVLEPITALSQQRLAELAELCVIEPISKTLDPFRVKGVAGQLVFLLKGELALILGNGSSDVVVGGTPEARHPLGRKTPFAQAKAITDIELLRIDEDLLDIMVTWDQLAAAERTGSRATESAAPSMTNWSILTGLFSINNLKSGAFAQLPSAHINEMLRRFARQLPEAGQVVVEGRKAISTTSSRPQVPRRAHRGRGVDAARRAEERRRLRRGSARRERQAQCDGHDAGGRRAAAAREGGLQRAAQEAAAPEP
jgi:hypothetical protein